MDVGVKHNYHVGFELGSSPFIEEHSLRAAWVSPVLAFPFAFLLELLIPRNLISTLDPFPGFHSDRFKTKSQFLSSTCMYIFRNGMSCH